MDYDFRAIEAKWQRTWKDSDAYKVTEDTSKPKYYVLDMFPYPSGAGLHVGHPLGYIASDVYARYKRHKGFNVLHPMGYDSFGLPAEQYAIQTGQHPAITTEQNIARYRDQLEQLGFCFDWSREVRTSDPSYYKWTQWIFGELFESWYDTEAQKARPIAELAEAFAENGNFNVHAACDEHWWKGLSFPHFGAHFDGTFTATDWDSMSEQERAEVLMAFRIAYLADSEVNWCPALGTVLANDEVKDGLSERGGHPVMKKTMRQWMMRITAYADRLLDSLENLDWTDSVKDAQRHWIGRLKGGRSVRRGQRCRKNRMRRAPKSKSSPPALTPCTACPSWSSRQNTSLVAQTSDARGAKSKPTSGRRHEIRARSPRRQKHLWGLHRGKRRASHFRSPCSRLDCRLRLRGVRNGRHHGGSCRRRARLALCQAL